MKENANLLVNNRIPTGKNLKSALGVFNKLEINLNQGECGILETIKNAEIKLKSIQLRIQNEGSNKIKKKEGKCLKGSILYQDEENSSHQKMKNSIKPIYTKFIRSGTCSFRKTGETDEKRLSIKEILEKNKSMKNLNFKRKRQNFFINNNLNEETLDNGHILITNVNLSKSPLLPQKLILNKNTLPINTKNSRKKLIIDIKKANSSATKKKITLDFSQLKKVEPLTPEMSNSASSRFFVAKEYFSNIPTKHSFNNTQTTLNTLSINRPSNASIQISRLKTSKMNNSNSTTSLLTTPSHKALNNLTKLRRRLKREVKGDIANIISTCDLNNESLRNHFELMKNQHEIIKKRENDRVIQYRKQDYKSDREIYGGLSHLKEKLRKGFFTFTQDKKYKDENVFITCDKDDILSKYEHLKYISERNSYECKDRYLYEFGLKMNDALLVEKTKKENENRERKKKISCLLELIKKQKTNANNIFNKIKKV